MKTYFLFDIKQYKVSLIELKFRSLTSDVIKYVVEILIEKNKYIYRRICN